VAVSVGPEEGDQVDPPDDGVMLARPVMGDQLDGLGIGLIEGRVVNDENPGGEPDLGSGLPPEFFGVGFEAGQESAEGVVGRRVRRVGLDPCRLGRGIRPRGGNQEVDVGRVD